MLPDVAIPKQIRMDNGTELISRAMLDWAEYRGIDLASIQPGKPAQNAYIERFNLTFREDVLDTYLFTSVQDARDINEEWIVEYNVIRPHVALQDLYHYQYAVQYS